MTISAKRLHELLAYDAATGIFTWRVDRRGGGKGRAKAGLSAGRLDKHGYLEIWIDRRSYRAHRLVWLYVHGELPPEQIDHINGKPADNRLVNLRLASHAENCWNSIGKGKNLKGAFWDRSKWFSVIWINGRRNYLGRFATEQEAHSAYMAAAKRWHGEFVNAR
jgi:HNH endonuclease